ncbi:TonB-dependent receptor [Alteraurantiacibacter aquimixticola]|uniref:TonB-dependent receptor n=1 Tax=Alteraurantiacibacter aquimixticola TaxID=2489173 RepID=UPI001B7D778B|nr:TonB-dependent receptor [Alteraurantiacibacter aquimixticola]
MRNSAKLKLRLLSATIISSTMLAMPAMAQSEESEEGASGNTILVTATRRATTIMDTPINITAVSAEELQRQRIDDIRDIADFTPGVTISDTGGGTTGDIVLRGLNATDVDDFGSNFDDALGIYLGEVPLYYDFKLIDIERVETLLGPQGTLYGLGTLAGAIRYIPNRPDPTAIEGSFHARGYAKSESDDFGYQVDGVINLPIVRDHIAFRSATGYYFDPGYIDYPLLVQEPGISNPQPDGPDSITQAGYDANLFEAEDLNFERTFTSRNQLLFQTDDNLQLLLTYAYQQTKTDGASSNSAGVLGTGVYENASRFEEPVDRHAHLASAQINANIADIVDVVATGAYTETKFDALGDVTDLLLDLDYGYELYPGFAGFFQSDQKRKQKNAEIRFVSSHGGPLSWVLGGFYNENKFNSDYAERLPNHPWGDPATNPEFLEYVSYVESEVKEKAVFGEATFQIIPQWQVTAGARYFDYTSTIAGAAALPFLGDPLDPRELDVNGGDDGQDGWVWKFNTSFDITPDIMIYGTYSKGYRLGGPNRVAPCPPDIPVDPTEYTGDQIICALPNEEQYGPDTTKNLELGIRAQLFDDILSLNFNVFQIKWDGIQVNSATTYGVTGITVNGGTGESEGFETSFVIRPVPQLTIRGTYSYLDAKLTQDVPGLISVNDPAGTYPSAPISIDALDGDRLPGSAKNSGSLGVTYVTPMADGELIANWTAVYRGNVVSRLGYERAFGDLIPSFTTHRASVAYEWDNYTISLWANNIFNNDAIVSVTNDRSRTGLNDGVVLRYYRQVPLNPRTVGVEGRVSF